MGLKFPEDLTAWQKWQATAKAETRIKDLIKALPHVLSGATGEVIDGSVEPQTGMLHLRGTAPKLLVALDSTSPTSVNSLVLPLTYLAEQDVAVWAPAEITGLLPGDAAQWSVEPAHEHDLDSLTDLKIVMALGHYMGWGAAAFRLSQRCGARFITVQHGLHTPYAPPLAPGTQLLAFSQKDADFWISDRKDVTYDVVGSQLFWEAAQKPRTEVNAGEGLIFLGQMHGAELPRSSFAYSSIRFTKEHGALYRPHPSEKDKLSRATHRLMQTMGITLDYSQKPLNQVNTPVVSIFSTGVLEAAIRGIPAWVYHANPPAWLTEFWERYGMKQWGGDPTPAPALPEVEPAQRIADIITRDLEK